MSQTSCLQTRFLIKPFKPFHSFPSTHFTITAKRCLLLSLSIVTLSMCSHLFPVCYCYCCCESDRLEKTIRCLEEGRKKGEKSDKTKTKPKKREEGERADHEKGLLKRPLSFKKLIYLHSVGLVEARG